MIKILTFFALLFIFWDYKSHSVFKLAFANAFLFSAVSYYKLNSIKYAIFTFVLAYFISYFLISAIFKKEKNDIKKKNELDDYIGKKAIVKKDIGKTISIDGIGFVEYNNELWQAKSIDDKEIKANKEVEIVSVENMIMNVKKL